VDKFFKTLAKLASRPTFSLAKIENNWPNILKGSVKGGLVSELVFLLANREFYLHLASWRVVFRTPLLFVFCSLHSLMNEKIVHC
jgi:hypothetical protein